LSDEESSEEPLDEELLELPDELSDDEPAEDLTDDELAGDERLDGEFPDDGSSAACTIAAAASDPVSASSRAMQPDFLMPPRLEHVADG
jgi:hypothetical protein